VKVGCNACWQFDRCSDILDGAALEGFFRRRNRCSFQFLQGALDHGKIGHAIITSELIAICAEIILDAAIEARPSGNVELPNTLDFQVVADMCIGGGANATRFALETEGYPWPMKRLHQIGFFRAAMKLGCMFPDTSS